MPRLTLAILTARARPYCACKMPMGQFHGSRAGSLTRGTIGSDNGVAHSGRTRAAEKAIAYLQNSQLEDGSWWGQLGSAVPIDMELHQFTTEGMDTGHQVRDTNFTAYIATAAYHHYLTFQDMAYTQNLWPRRGRHHICSGPAI